MKEIFLNIKFNLYSKCINYFLLKKKYKTVEYFLIKKRKVVSKMRDNFKVVNGRDVTSIGYDAHLKICVIAYNHKKNGKSIYYYNVTQEQFDKVFNSTDIAAMAETVFEK